jgi:hypothetical protein
MGYGSRRGRKPQEWASKSAHVNVIKDPAVQAFLAGCSLPKSAEEVLLPPSKLIEYKPVESTSVRHIIAIDGGYSEVPVRAEFPSATICFFQFGALTFSLADLESLEASPFIEPEDMAKLKRMQRLKFTMPVRNVLKAPHPTLITSVRGALYDFFAQSMDGGTLLETLKWFVFEEFDKVKETYELANCPVCHKPRVLLSAKQLGVDYTLRCPQCRSQLYLTDVFRLHEAVDNELGAAGILGYVTTLLEQILLIHLLRLVLHQRPALLRELFFLKDGPLAFFGQTANMHKPMRALVRYLLNAHDLFLVGVEKSGPFVEHAAAIAELLPSSTVLLLDNSYIYKYIIPGAADADGAYGRTTYYGNKLIFKSRDSSLYVITLPTTEPHLSPKASDFKNLREILTLLEKLRCDMFDDALIPVALANKLVSLSNRPSTQILQRFATGAISKQG